MFGLVFAPISLPTISETYLAVKHSLCHIIFYRYDVVADQPELDLDL
jgi:hypothetical protein